MKNIFITLVILSFTFVAFSQTVLQSENFDSFAGGDSVALDDPTGKWTTLHNDPGSKEDAIIVDSFSTSGSNSLLITTTESYTPNFPVYRLDKKTEGRFQLSFDMFIKKDSMALFSVFQQFTDVTNLKSGVDVNFRSTGGPYQEMLPDGEGTIWAEGKRYRFHYNSNEWVNIKLIVDIDDDFATLYVNNNELIHFKWSLGTSGFNEASSIQAVMFGGIFYVPIKSGFFIDNVEFSSVDNEIEKPSNLISEVISNDITLTWDAPASYTPVNYLVEKDGVIVDTVEETTYTDLNVYPGATIYRIRANAGTNGYSAAVTDTVTVDGGVEKINTLFEIFTGTWCGYCPGAAMGADDLIENGNNTAIVEYHRGDRFDNYSSSYRDLKYYEIHAYPTSIVDGIIRKTVGSIDESSYTLMKQMHDLAKGKKALHSINITANRKNDTIINVNITVTQEFEYFTNPKIRVALTELHIPEDWGGGLLNEVNFVLRKMYPNAKGETLDFTQSTTLSFEYDVDINSNVSISNYEIVVFVQDDDTKAVSQAVKLNLDAVGIIDNVKQQSLTLYPNPTTGTIYINNGSEQKISSVEVYNTSGILIEKINNTGINTVSLNKYESGLYLIKVNFDTHSELYRIIKE